AFAGRYVRLQAVTETRSRKAAAVQTSESRLKRNLQSSQVSAGIQAAWAERNVGQRLVPGVVAPGGRHLLYQVDVGFELPARRGAARTAHRKRHVRTSQHGVVDHLWTGHRESEHARIYHDLPY